MPERIQIPPEICLLDADEFRHIQTYQHMKRLGGLSLDGDEWAPADGYEPGAKDANPVIRRHDICLSLHVDEVNGKDLMLHDLVVTGTYIALHERLRRVPHIITCTYPQMARLAARLGFLPLEPRNIDSHTVDTVRHAYEKTRLAKRPGSAFVLSMGYMPVPEFMERYAVGIPPTDPQSVPPQPVETGDVSGVDSLTAAINRVTDTLR